MPLLGRADGRNDAERGEIGSIVRETPRQFSIVKTGPHNEWMEY